jgi:hypothetical protein
MDPDSGEIIKNGVLSLTHIARLKCINNAHIINDIGRTPYHLIKPVLMKKTAKSLKQIEKISPQIILDSEELWKDLLKRDFPDRPINQTILKNGEKLNISSRNLYDKYSNERENQRKNAIDNYKLITKNLNDMKNKNKVKSINKILPMKSSKSQKSHSTNSTSSHHTFKSSLLQKARVANKQRVRNFSQPKNIIPNKLSTINLKNSDNLVIINQRINNNPTDRRVISKQIQKPISSSSTSLSSSLGKRKLDTPFTPINKERLKRSNTYIHKEVS